MFPNHPENLVDDFDHLGGTDKTASKVDFQLATPKASIWLLFIVAAPGGSRRLGLQMTWQVYPK